MVIPTASYAPDPSVICLTLRLFSPAAVRNKEAIADKWREEVTKMRRRGLTVRHGMIDRREGCREVARRTVRMIGC